MLKLIQVPNNGVPTHLPLLNPDDQFEPGQVYVKDGKSKGIIDDVKNDEDDSTAGTGKIVVWNCRTLIETDQFTECDGPLNSDLYVAKDGRLTCNPKLGIKCPAILTGKYPTRGTIEFLWLGSE